MAENYGHLLQAMATKNTTNEVFRAKENTKVTIIKDVDICNTSNKERKFCLAITKNDEPITNKAYLFYETKIDAYETLDLTTTWCLEPGAKIIFYSDEDNSVVINGFGIEVKD